MRTIIPSAILLIAVQANAASPDYCRLYAREYLRIGLLHNLALVNNPEISKEVKAQAMQLLDQDIKWLLDRNYAVCLNSDEEPKLPDVPTASDESWLTFMARNSVEIEPDATAKHEWCHRNYKSYNEEDGTVLRSSRKQRSACPYPGVE